MNTESIYRQVIENIYDSSYEESKVYLLILIIILLICSLFGSISNLFVIFIFNFKFNQNLKFKLTKPTTTTTRHRSKNSILQSCFLKHTVSFIDNNNNNNTSLRSIKTTKPNKKLQAVTFETNPEQQQQQQDLIENVNNNKKISLYTNYNYKHKKQFFYNSNLKLFYTLIRYLAIVDFLTCSIAIPITAYEIWYNMKMNEIFCKLFEFIRAVGVIASNFIIILIAIERYIALCKLRNFKVKLFKLRIFLVIFLTIFIGIICMLQVSSYQRVDNYVIYIGICLQSQLTFRNELSKLIWLLITLLFIIGSLFVSVLYILIFKRTFELNKRREMRKKRENRIFKRALSNSFSNKNGEVKATTSSNKNIERKLSMVKDSKMERKSCCWFYLNRNFRIAVMILLVTVIYYLSIIPWCLAINDIIRYNPYIHYSFLLNNTINPLIYGFLNPYFRNCCLYIFKSMFSSMSNKVYNLVHG
jgi:hypothetical protein